MAKAGTIVSVEDMELGGMCYVSFNSPSALYYYKIRFSLDTWEGWSEVLHFSSTGLMSYFSNRIIPEVVCRRLPNSMQGTMTATLYTYTDSACKKSAGYTSSKTFTVYVPSNVKPSITSTRFTLSNDKSIIDTWRDGQNPVAVAGFTKINALITSSGIYYSSVINVTLSGEINKVFEGNRIEYSHYLTAGNNKKVTIVARDTRGQNSDPTEISFVPDKVYAYQKPEILTFTAGRDLSNPTKISVKANWIYSSINGHNQTTATLKYKERSASTWTTYTGTINNNTLTTLSSTFEIDKSYNFIITITDSLDGKAQRDFFVATMSTPLHLRAGGRGLGIGKIAESDNLEIGFQTIFMNKVFIQVGGNQVSLVNYIKGVMNGTYT